jgi:hypothetical protein
LISADYFTGLIFHVANAVRARLRRQFFKVIDGWRANGMFNLGKLAPLFAVEFTTPRFWSQPTPLLKRTRRRDRGIDREFRATNRLSPGEAAVGFPRLQSLVHAGEIEPAHWVNQRSLDGKRTPTGDSCKWRMRLIVLLSSTETPNQI